MVERHARIARIKARIERGTYDVDAHAVADALIGFPSLAALEPPPAETESTRDLAAAHGSPALVAA